MSIADRPRARHAAFVGLGAIAALGQAPWGLWPLTIIAIGLAFALRRRARAGWRAGAFAGWLLGLGYFAVALHWIVQPFLVDVARHGWMAPFALVFMAGGMALFWAAAFGLASRARSGRWPLAAAGALGLAEVVRSLVLTGFPWALLGHVWIGTPLAQVAALMGPHGLTLLAVAVPAAVVGFWGRVWAPLAAAAIAVLWVVAAPGPQDAPAGDRPLVRIVQPNAEQHLKWQPGMAQVFFERLLTLTAGAEDAPRPDLIVWPETAMQWLLEQADDPIEDLTIAARGTPVVFGIQRREERRYFNSLVVLDGAGQIHDLYDKWHLVPFGEYIPFGELAAQFGIHGLAASEGGGYTPGPGPGLVSIPGLGRAMALICYEGIFAEEVNAAPERPDVLILITNDAWFGNWAGPEQHLAQARLRAIEQGLPLIRVANTGISTVIGPDGGYTEALALNTAGALDLRLPAPEAATLYSKSGDYPAIAVMWALLAGAFWPRRRV